MKPNNMALLPSYVVSPEFTGKDDYCLKFFWKYNNDDDNDNFEFYMFINLIICHNLLCVDNLFETIQIILFWCFKQWYFPTRLC
jgi:hypothetical protein